MIFHIRYIHLFYAWFGSHKVLITLIIKEVLLSFELMLMPCLLGKKNHHYQQKANYFLLQISVNNVFILESLGGL